MALISSDGRNKKLPLQTLVKWEQFTESLDKLIGLIDEYDYIYACHDEYCLNSDYVYMIKDAWNKVLNNELTYEMIDVHGNKVKSYTDEYCGFYCEQFCKNRTNYTVVTLMCSHMKDIRRKN